MPSPDLTPRRPGRTLTGLAPLGAACLWGGMYVVSKASFASLAAITLGFLRLLIGGSALWLVLQISERRFPQRREILRRLLHQERWRLFLLGLCIAATITSQFLGTSLATAHDGASLTTMTPIFIVPLAWWLLGERPSWRVIGGTLVALTGVALIIGSEQEGSSPADAAHLLVGDGLLLISALCWALFTVLGTPLVRKSSALIVSTYGTLWSLTIFAPLALLTAIAGRPTLPPLETLGGVLYLGIGATALAWYLWYRGVEQLPASVTAVFFFAQPLVGGVLSMLLLHEQVGAGFWVGGTVLALGILLVSL